MTTSNPRYDRREAVICRLDKSRGS